MNRPFAGFDWDEGNRTKCLKHGVPLSDIETLFDRVVFVLPDAQHSSVENRIRAIGKTESGRSVFLVFTIRERNGQKIHQTNQRAVHASKGDCRL